MPMTRIGVMNGFVERFPDWWRSCRTHRHTHIRAGWEGSQPGLAAEAAVGNRNYWDGVVSRALSPAQRY